MNTIISLTIGTVLTALLVGLTISFGLVGFACGVFLFLIAGLRAK